MKLALGTPALARKRGPVLRQTKTKGGRLALVVINENTTAGAALQAALVHYLFFTLQLLRFKTCSNNQDS